MQKLTAAARPLAVGTLGFLLALTQSGCLIIGGHSSRGGFFYIPGGIVGLLLILFVLSSLRRR